MTFKRIAALSLSVAVLASSLLTGTVLASEEIEEVPEVIVTYSELGAAPLTFEEADAEAEPEAYHDAEQEAEAPEEVPESEDIEEPDETKTAEVSIKQNGEEFRDEESSEDGSEAAIDDADTEDDSLDDSAADMDVDTEKDRESISEVEVFDEDDIALHPIGTAPMTLWEDDVSNSVAEAGYFPTKYDVLHNRVSGIFTVFMIMWHEANGADCYRVKDTYPFANVLGGHAEYGPRPGDLIYYCDYEAEYGAGPGAVISGFTHVGIVSAVGEDYIETIEGNTAQRVYKLTYTTNSYSGGSGHFAGAWIVDVFSDDQDARDAYVAVARDAWEEAENDAWYGRCGMDSWCESNYNGVYQNDTIASGYFQFPAEWCQMFILWCAFNADMPEVDDAISEHMDTLMAGQSLGCGKKLTDANNGKAIENVFFMDRNILTDGTLAGGEQLVEEHTPAPTDHRRASIVQGEIM